MAGSGIPLAGNPNQAALIGLSPSANLGGFNTAAPIISGRTDAGIGGGSNPFLPTPTGGTSMPSTTSPLSALPASTTVPSFPANTGGGDGSLAPPLDITSLLGLTGGGGTAREKTTGGYGLFPSGTIGGANFSDVGRGLSQAGYKSGIANLLAQFLFSGAGYNPQVAQALIAQMQPTIARGSANIMEQFGAGGLADSSAAAIGLGDYLSQVQLNEGEILANLYEQSVQNYLNVLTGAKAPSKTGGGLTAILGSLLGAAGQTFQGAGTQAVCWVASELYGGWFAPETVSIRTWLHNTWWMRPFLLFYIAVGRQWAAWIRRCGIARVCTQKLFDTFLRLSNGRPISTSA
jgi:hypothetical protein